MAEGQIYTILTGNQPLEMMMVFSIKSGLTGEHGEFHDYLRSALAAPSEAPIFRDGCEVHQPHIFPDLAEVGTGTKARATFYKT